MLSYMKYPERITEEIIDKGFIFPPQPGPFGYRLPAAEERKKGNNAKSRTSLNTFQAYTIPVDPNFLEDLNDFFQNSEEDILQPFENKCKENRGVKWYICIKVGFIRKITESEEEICDSHFRSV
ncbi:hypothetical protein NPIL_87641 [Nephila pilipes]|uniref:Uncharacterized protein n=1 Tax=Nephila pilipes TaxID=299642 RepID=A0A8X6P208_NEPPI|nr:hypothetical protein NPIL_87641 [Nephila pilipes]